jgi:alanine racemase
MTVSRAVVPASRAVAAINLAAVERNCAALAARLEGGAGLCAVVKADGYGHGATPCAQAALAGGARSLAVATAPEAQDLRRGGITAPVLVMGALTPSELDVALAADAAVVAWREGFVDAVAAAAGARGAPARVHVKLDTGMGRLGTRDVDEARRVVAAVDAAPGLELAGAMTHFATADEVDDAFFGEQLAAFVPFADEVKAAHPDAVVHAANSAGTLRDPASHLDLVRCGIAIYGLDPFQRDPADHGLEPALELRSYVAAVKPVGAGQSVGYGRTWIAERPTEVGTVPVGYGDGVRRALSNDADVLVGGRRRPLVGTVSMDNVTVDLGPGTDVRAYDEAVLIGRQGDERVLAEEWARRLGTINYEITCAVTARVPRAHHRDGS